MEKSTGWKLFSRYSSHGFVKSIWLYSTWLTYCKTTHLQLQSKTVTLIYSYLKHRKQVKVNSFLSDFLTLLSGVPQGSILGPILFSIFLNDLLSTLKLSDLFNFAYDSSTADNIDHLLLTLKHELKLAVKLFADNQMIVNLDKLIQTMILQNSKNSKNYEPIKLGIASAKIKTKNTVKLLGITIDNS